MTDAQVTQMAARFLAWRLPENFGPDNGIRFDRSRLHPNHWPIGTNLFDARQAEEMVRHMVDNLPEAAPADPVAGVGEARDWQPMRTAPRDGTEIETLCVHATAHYSTDAFGEGWAAVVRARWTDHNDGGWTWHGLCGTHMAWRPVAALAPSPSAEKLVGVLEPFAALADKFTGPMVEVSDPHPDNPSRNIQPFATRHLENAFQALAALRPQVEQGQANKGEV